MSHAGKLINYEATPGFYRRACAQCGSFVYKTLGNGVQVVSIAKALSDAKLNNKTEVTSTWSPTGHIFYPFRSQDVNDELPKYDAFP